MKAYRMTAWKTAPEYQEVPQPEPGPGQVLVKVGAAGICHSDVHVIHEFDEGVFNASLPFTLGHENAGWVEALGPGASGLEVGQAVAVYGPLGCGNCARCQVGDENLCDRLAELPGAGWGLGVDGGMAQYMLVDSPRQLAPLGDLDPVLAAPLTDAAVTPYRAIKRSQRVLGPGSVVTVIGIGGLGHLAVQILRAITPSTVIAVDSRSDALAHATWLGAHHTVPAGDGAAQAIQDLTQGRGADLTLDLVGNEATMALAMATTRSAGRIMLVGVAGGAVPWSFWATKFEVELSVSTWGSISDLREVIALARSGLIAPTVTTYAFDDIPAAFDALESGSLEGRAVILPNG
jgi:propanol-preferring alcohol dehydrogenase